MGGWLSIELLLWHKRTVASDNSTIFDVGVAPPPASPSPTFGVDTAVGGAIIFGCVYFINQLSLPRSVLRVI